MPKSTASSTLSPLSRWWGPGLIMSALIGLLAATDLLLNGLLNHLPWWSIAATLIAPWTLPLFSLARRQWREAAIRAISLAVGMALGTTCLWLTYASLNQRTPPHPFPDSLQSVAASGTQIHEPLASNTATLTTEPQTEANRTGSLHFKETTADFTIKRGLQGGMYSAEIHANPGEPGTLFFRAVEPSTNTPLTEDSTNPDRRISQSTRHAAQYSNHPSDRFASFVGFKMTDGIWGQFYACRFELWFTPDSGGPPRQLHAKVFKVEGWQR